jgi:hypothetical protein
MAFVTAVEPELNILTNEESIPRNIDQTHILIRIKDNSKSFYSLMFFVNSDWMMIYSNQNLRQKIRTHLVPIGKSLIVKLQQKNLVQVEPIIPMLIVADIGIEMI